MGVITKTDDHQFRNLIAAPVGDELKSQLLTYRDVCDFLFADSVDSAFLLLGKNRFDLIFIDRNFAAKDLLAYIKILSRDTPLIALIENNSLAERKQLISAGFDDCLMQPLTAENILETASFWLDEDELATLSTSIRNLLVKFNNNYDIVTNLWQVLFTELPAQLRQLATAIHSQDYALVYEIVHKINGSAKVCLLQEIGSIAARFEEALTHREYGNLESDYQILKRKISKLITWREYILRQLSNN